MAILKCLHDYVVADNDVTIAGRALHSNATLSLATSFLLFESYLTVLDMLQVPQVL